MKKFIQNPKLMYYHLLLMYFKAFFHMKFHVIYTIYLHLLAFILYQLFVKTKLFP